MDSFIRIVVPLKQKGGISIRRYSTRSGEADYEHIMCDGKPVIPGTSWNGAIRADAKRILLGAGVSRANADKIIRIWFGHIKDKEVIDPAQSMLVISESLIQGDYKLLPITRNRIDRITGGTVDGALYSDVSCFEGETELEILVRRDEKEGGKWYKSLVAMMLLVIKDLENGFLAVGGQTAIGRGVFEKSKSKSTMIVALSDEFQKECNRCLYSLVKENGEEEGEQ